MMSRGNEWHESIGRQCLFWEVWQLKWADFAGSCYRVAKTPRGFRKRFWTLKGAQAYADKLNAALAKDPTP